MNASKHGSRALFVALSLFIGGCLCSGEPSDEERLKAAIDSTPVHIYLGIKSTLASASTDPEIAEARESVMKIVSGAGPGDDTQGGLGSADVLAMGKAAMKLREAGKDLAADPSTDTEPLLPVLLKTLDAPPKVIETFDAQGEHAVLFGVMSILKLSEKSPVPIPTEIVLYEAWKTDPSRVKIPGARVPLHSGKAWIYSQNDYCTLAAIEAEAAAAQKLSAKDVMAGLRLFGVPREKIREEKLAEIDGGFKALANGGVALCHYGKGDDKGARPWLSKVVVEAEKTGLVPPEDLEFLKVFLDCGGSEEEVATGMKKLVELEKNPTEDLKALRAYCEASDETSFELARKVSLSAKLMKVGLSAASESGAADQLEDTKPFGAVKGLATACEGLAADSSSLLNTLGGLKESASKALD